MPAEPHAVSTVAPPEPPVGADYDAICAAVTATARGRWFLEEFAKRNRNSDTMQVLAAIAEMRAAVVDERIEQASREAHQEVRVELLEMARAIAQARAEVAESRPAPTQPMAAALPDAAPAPDVATAAERLRQIAWTIRACGVELPAAEQIGEIANAILSADALRGLDEQRAQKLTEALHYLEHRIERMLDGHRAAAGDATRPEPVADAPQSGDDAGTPAPVALAVAMIAAALRPDTAEANAPPSPARTEATATSMAQSALAVSDAAEYPMDDDVVLTVAGGAVEPPAVEPAFAAVSPQDEAPTIARIEPAPIAEQVAPEPVLPEPVAPAAADALQAEHAAFEFEPLTPAGPTTGKKHAKSGGLELEPLAVVAPVTIAPPVAAVPATDARPPVEAVTNALVAGTAAEEPLAQPAIATVEPAAEPDDPDSEANDNLPMMLAAQAGIVTVADAVAMQVDQDLEGLADPAPGDTVTAAPQRAVAPAAAAQVAMRDEPAEPLRELSPHQARVSAAVAGAQAARAELSDTLAAIENELFGSTRPDARTDSAPSTAIPATPVKSVAPPVPAGPLAALMAMSEEERIALFS